MLGLAHRMALTATFGCHVSGDRTASKGFEYALLEGHAPAMSGCLCTRPRRRYMRSRTGHALHSPSNPTACNEFDGTCEAEGRGTPCTDAAWPRTASPSVSIHVAAVGKLHDERFRWTNSVLPVKKSLVPACYQIVDGARMLS
jgi:hypothetical protein